MVTQPKSSVPKYQSLATSGEEAENRFKLTFDNDPFPSIPPSLLNSADIWDYANATGMIYPFYEQDIKSASYQIRFLGHTVYWDGTGKKHDKIIEEGDEFELGPNSIAFVTTEPKFRLPDYIAVRFNLRIEHVHRGILLGTGPLVDPGFEGKLLIPLHNLTTNSYTLKAGEELIWVEFTKISPHSRWHPEEQVERNQYGLTRDYIQFSEDKKNKGADYYLRKASPHSPIRSSIPDIISEAAQTSVDASNAAKSARDNVNSIRRRLTNIGMFGGSLALAAIAFTFYQVWISIHNLNSKDHGRINLLASEIEILRTTNKTLSEKLTKIDQELSRSNNQNETFRWEYLEKNFSSLQNDLNNFRLRTENVEAKLRELENKKN